MDEFVQVNWIKTCNLFLFRGPTRQHGSYELPRNGNY